MDKDQYTSKRKSYMEIGEVFFWTATINNPRRGSCPHEPLLLQVPSCHTNSLSKILLNLAYG
jgi:hypothetical protein